MDRIDRTREQVSISDNTFFLECIRCLTLLKELKMGIRVSYTLTYLTCKHIKTPHRLLCEWVCPALFSASAVCERDLDDGMLYCKRILRNRLLRQAVPSCNIACPIFLHQLGALSNAVPQPKYPSCQASQASLYLHLWDRGFGNPRAEVLLFECLHATYSPSFESEIQIKFNCWGFFGTVSCKFIRSLVLGSLVLLGA